jgi:hypothetical protein
MSVARIQPPALPAAGFGSFAANGGIQINIQNRNTYRFDSVGSAAQALAFGEQVGRAEADVLDRQLGASLRGARLRSGNPTARG